MPTTPVPLTTDVVDGLINLRGQIVMAIDMRARLQTAATRPDQPSVSLILRTSDGLISLRVDRLGDVLDLDAPVAAAPADDRVRAKTTVSTTGRGIPPETTHCGRPCPTRCRARCVNWYRASSSWTVAAAGARSGTAGQTGGVPAAKRR